MSFKEKIEDNKWVVIVGLITAMIVGIGEILDVWEKLCEKFRTKSKIEILDKSTFNKTDITKIYSLIPELIYSNQDSSTQHDKIEDFFVYANNDIIDSINKLFIDNRNSLMFLSGSAGVGKSFVLSNLEKSISCDSCHFIEININELAHRDKLDTEYFEMITDLKNLSGDPYSNLSSSLPTLKPEIDLSIDNIMSIRNKAIKSSTRNAIMFDGFDEIHKFFCRELIKSSINYLHTTRNTVDIMIIGRPESFHDYYSDPSRPTFDINNYKIQIPQFKTFGDVLLRVAGYDEYVDNSINISATAKNLSKLLSDGMANINDLGYLAVGNYLIEAAATRSDYRKDELEKFIFESMLKRNHDTHGRPSQGDELYLEILMEIARKYSSRIDTNGYFRVGFPDKVEAVVSDEDAIHNVEFRVRDILNRSGLIDMEPPSFKNPRYKFQPLWIHAYLLKISK